MIKIVRCRKTTTIIYLQVLTYCFVSQAPAYSLDGLLLNNTWLVTKKLPKQPDHSGGNFSVGYLATNQNDGTQVFIKALDFSKALRSSDPALALLSMTTAYTYERDLLNIVRGKRMTRVAVSLDDGYVDVDPTSVIGKVPYIVFECAESDVRTYQVHKGFDTAWILRCLHHITVGVDQLNRGGIAHQDLKPSNVLVFNGNSSKIGDLGRAILKGTVTPYDRMAIAGDQAYAPLELFYGYVPGDWSKHRVGCDLYQLGSMFVFLFSNTTINALVSSKLNPKHYPMAWSGTFTDVLPHLLDAFDKAINDFGNSVPSEYREDVIEIVRQLCNPEPEFRGHPVNRKGLSNPHSLERYISRLDLLATKAERGLGRII
jgi:eukaryotic-like serine/threonine-protein kinase